LKKRKHQENLLFARAGVALPFLREYVRHHFNMIVFSAAHQSSKGLSVPNEKSARHIDMKIILWIFYRFFQIHRRRSRIDMPKPYGVIMDFSRTHRGRCPIDMTPSLSD